MMRSREGRQSRPGTAFHTKNTVICHILSRLCLNVTPILITRVTKLFCSSGISASVLKLQEGNPRKGCSCKQGGEVGGLMGQRRVVGDDPEAWCFLVLNGRGIHLSFVASSLVGQMLRLVTKSGTWCISSVAFWFEKGRLSLPWPYTWVLVSGLVPHKA